jgi:hypothetical protein
MTPKQLKDQLNAKGSKFFTPNNMKFAGDTMRNYGVSGPMEIVTNNGDKATVYELYRKKPVKNGLQKSAYFDAVTFEQHFKAS